MIKDRSWIFSVAFFAVLGVLCILRKDAGWQFGVAGPRLEGRTLVLFGVAWLLVAAEIDWRSTRKKKSVVAQQTATYLPSEKDEDDTDKKSPNNRIKTDQ